MHPTADLLHFIPLLPGAAMLLAAMLPLAGGAPAAVQWRRFHAMAAFGLLAGLAGALLQVLAPEAALPTGAPWLKVTLVGSVLAVLVQGLVVVLGHFSARYLRGEDRQPRAIAALAAVLAAVHALLLADHWLVLIAAWAAVGLALERLLCFYADRPFALLAAHKKRLADRLADGLLLAAAALCWTTVGSGSFSDLAAHLQAQGGAAPALQWAAVLLALAVLLRTALLPVHGWLIQVMEAPTPVSALLHAGVVNLGGYVLIRLWPLLEQATAARWLLVALGAATAVLAGLVMLTRVSIKVRLAWSTVAQMGFMVLECGLGLTTLALLHLIGHALYKSHGFLMASDTVRQARLQDLRGPARPSAASVLAAPLMTVPLVLLLSSAGAAAGHAAAWPWWWSVVLGLAWAPLLWRTDALPAGSAGAVAHAPQRSQAWLRHVLLGLALTALLTLAARLAHGLPWGLADAPATAPGLLALASLALLHALQAVLLLQPAALPRLRRWAYAGFYLDERFTRLTLRCWPARWVPPTPVAQRGPVATTRTARNAA